MSAPAPHTAATGTTTVTATGTTTVTAAATPPDTPRRVRVGVLGARGRMGRAVCAAVDGAPDLELAVTTGRGDPLDPLAEVDVAVDFSTPEAVLGHVEWLLAHGVHTVVGTSGVGAGEQARLAEAVASAPGVGVHVVPNFSIAAVLASRLAAEAVCFFDDAEIVEYAGRHKTDAPSGTAEQTARLLAEARAGREEAAVPSNGPTSGTTTCGLPVHGIPVHSVRMKGLLSRQDVHLSRTAELLTIHFETNDRAAFMPGVLLAVRRIAGRPGLTVGLDAILDAPPLGAVHGGGHR